jgi:prepilin-type N-terminal cleavage/methylation domain-containing protein
MTPPRYRTNRTHATLRPQPLGFTLIEILVVVIIIAALIAITIPVVSSVRTRAQAANTETWVRQIASACDRYYQDFKAYPGPLSNNEIRASSVWTTSDFHNDISRQFQRHRNSDEQSDRLRRHQDLRPRL